MPDVILVLSLEDQPPVRVVLLGGTIQLSIHVGALEHAPVLVRVDTLALQRIVGVVALQGAVRKARTQGAVRPRRRAGCHREHRPLFRASSCIPPDD